MKKVRPVIIDGVEIMTSLSAVEIADLVEINEELKKENERLTNIINEYEDKGYDIAQERADFLLEIDQLTNNWNELEEWLKEYIKKNDNWYSNQLSTHDKQYYGDSYYTTNYMLEKFLDKMKEIKEGK